MLSNSTVIERRSGRILIVDRSESLGSVHYQSASVLSVGCGSNSLHLPESNAPASVDLLQMLVPSESVAECYS
jgi:hypothetical protein